VTTKLRHDVKSIFTKIGENILSRFIIFVGYHYSKGTIQIIRCVTVSLSACSDARKDCALLNHNIYSVACWVEGQVSQQIFIRAHSLLKIRMALNLFLQARLTLQHEMTLRASVNADCLEVCLEGLVKPLSLS
jgi:hypothetical protein